MSSFSVEALRQEAPWLKGKIFNNFGPARDASPEDVDNCARIVMDVISQHGLTNEPVALDGCMREFMMMESLMKLGVKEFKDGVIVSFDARSIKNEDEIACFRLACGAADAAFEDIRQAIRPGIRECDLMGIGMDVRAVWPKSPKHWGYENWGDVLGYALGHGLGISLHESPIMFFDAPGVGPNTTFKEGMVLAVETWSGRPGGNFGVRLEEDIVVTKDGYELLTKWPIDKITECWI